MTKNIINTIDQFEFDLNKAGIRGAIAGKNLRQRKIKICLARRSYDKEHN